MKMVTLAAGAFLAVCLGLSGCGKNAGSPKKEEKTQMWYLNSAEDGLEHADYKGTEESGEALRADFLRQLKAAPEETGFSPLLPEDVQVLSSKMEGAILTLNFSGEYQSMPATREVLTRAGIVRTFIQLDDVSGVRFEIEGKEAVTPTGVLPGVMDGNSFVEDAGKQINAIQHVAINLYFTGEDGKTLKREARSIYYTASKPLEWAVVERIIAGPKVEGNYATVPANTQIISVSSANGTCYVNLNQTFVSNALNVEEQIPIYSIVNSLVDDCRDVSQVQISVEGENSLIFKQSMDLSHPYEPNYTLVETVPQSAE